MQIHSLKNLPTVFRDHLQHGHGFRGVAMFQSLYYIIDCFPITAHRIAKNQDMPAIYLVGVFRPKLFAVL